jgi:hypothetical protein
MSGQIPLHSCKRWRASSSSKIRTKRTRHYLGLVFFLAALLASPAPRVLANPGEPVLQSFEDLAPGSPVYNQYDGVTFIGGNNTNPDGSHPITIFQPASGTISASNAVQSNIHLSCEFCGTSLTLRFDEPQYRVSLSTGLAISYPYAPLTVLLLGYDGDPESSGSTVVVQSVAPCLGTAPTSVTTPLAIFDISARISYAQLWLVRCSDPLTPNLGPNQRTLVLDNLIYDRPASTPPRETDPPIITVTLPSNGATVTGRIPGELYLPVEATITETAIASLTARLNGRPPIAMTYRQTGPTNYQAMVSLDDADGLISGANTLVVTAVDFDRPAQTASLSINFIYQIAPIPPLSQLDIWPTAIQVTQVIDKGPRHLSDFDRDFTLGGYRVERPHPVDPRLMQGKDTLIRVYGAASGTTSAVPNVPAVAYVRYADSPNGCQPVWGQGMAPRKTQTAGNYAGITIAPFGTPESVPDKVVGNLGATWNFVLPAAGVTRDMIVTIYINDGRYKHKPNQPHLGECDFVSLPEQPSVKECDFGSLLTCSHNNRLELHLHFEKQEQIIVHPVLLRVSGSYNGQTYGPLMPQPVQVDAIFNLMNKLYPLRVVRGQTLRHSVNADITGSDLVSEIRNNFGTDSKPRELHLGIFPGDQGDFAANERTPTSVVTGKARRGERGAWSNADSPISAAHEIGHNLGLMHHSCDHGEEEGGGSDCDYPIPHGGIGGFGTDIANWRIIAPGDTSSSETLHAHDFMSYGHLCRCNIERWVSWYTYEFLRTHPGFDHDLQIQADTTPRSALLVRGQIDASGVATLKPVYQVTAQLAPRQPLDIATTEVYTLQGFDPSGNTLFVHNFTPHPLMDANESLLYFEELVPVVANLDRLVVLKGAQKLGERTNAATGQPPTVGLGAPIAGSTWPVGIPQTIRWVAHSSAGLPLVAQVQYSPDSGATRITLARDVTGNEFTINPDELPGSTRGYIIVQVSDGLNSVETAAGPLTIANKPPAVHIISPLSGSTVAKHVPISLESDAYDPEQALDGLTFRWSSSRDGQLGVDQNLVVSELSAGSHRLTLTVTDRQGLVGQASVDIQVQAGYKLFLPFIRHN